MKNWLGREPEINDLQTENRPVRPITGLVLTCTILQLNELHAEITCGVSLFTPLPTRQPLYTIRRLNQHPTPESKLAARPLQPSAPLLAPVKGTIFAGLVGSRSDKARPAGNTSPSRHNRHSLWLPSSTPKRLVLIQDKLLPSGAHN